MNADKPAIDLTQALKDSLEARDVAPPPTVESGPAPNWKPLAELLIQCAEEDDANPELYEGDVEWAHALAKWLANRNVGIAADDPSPRQPVTGQQLADMIGAMLACPDCDGETVCAAHLEFFTVAFTGGRA